MSGSAVAAGDVRSTCGNCGSALIVERGGVVRLAEPPPGPAAAPQLIVPPTFEPPSHATAMREFAMADESANTDASPASAFYVARQAPTDGRDFNALLGADVRAYLDEGQGVVEPPIPTFSGPASFGSDVQHAGPELTPPASTFVPSELAHTPISVPLEVPSVVATSESAPEAPPFAASDAPEAAPESLSAGDAEAPEPYAVPEAAGEQPPTTLAAEPAVETLPAYIASGPENEPSQSYFAPVPETDVPQSYFASEPPPDTVQSTPAYEPPPYQPPAYENSVYSTRGPDGESRPPALMFPQSQFGGMTGPARESEPPQVASVLRPVERPAVEPEPELAPDTTPVAEPVLLTESADEPALLNLTSAMPEWSGESLDEAAPYVPPFSNPVSEDEIDGALGAEHQRRAAYPTPDSYFDASDPLAAAEADMYAGHSVVEPTEMVGDAFTAMVPPVGTYVPTDSPTIDLTPDAATRAAAEEAEDLAVLRAGRRKRVVWAATACFVFAVGAASYAASRGYLDGAIARVSAALGREPSAPGTDGRESVADGGLPSTDGRAPIADGRLPSTDGRAPIADGRLPSPDGRAPMADGGLPSTDGRAPIADAGLPTTEARDAKVEEPKPLPGAEAPPPATAEAKPVTPAESPDAKATDAKAEPTPTPPPPKGPPSKALNACYTKGNRLLNAKKVNLAIRELNKCLDIDPTYGRTYRSLGVAYMLLGRERSAILAYEKFVDYDPQHKDVAKVREIIADYYRRRKN